MKKSKLLTPNSNSSPDISGEKQIQRTYTNDEVKKLIFKTRMLSGDLNYTLYELGQNLMPKHLHGTEHEKKSVQADLLKKTSEVFYGFETESQVYLMEGFSERYRGGAQQICRQMIKDFDCRTDAEKSLAEITAAAFMRYLDASKRLNNCLDVDLYITPNKTAYMAMLSKERDRAHRQYLSGLMTLKQLKAPTIEMNIKAKTAFISQNQQINSGDSKHENNDAK
jgi:hypothetical protein